jgi:hypothetical protein
MHSPPSHSWFVLIKALAGLISPYDSVIHARTVLRCYPAAHQFDRVLTNAIAALNHVVLLKCIERRTEGVRIETTGLAQGFLCQAAIMRCQRPK